MGTFGKVMEGRSGKAVNMKLREVFSAITIKTAIIKIKFPLTALYSNFLTDILKY
jgi:hypothetical protein